MISPKNRLVIRSLANVAEILPFLLGHYPDDSIVLHFVGTSNFIDGPTMTCPLPDDPSDWKDAAESFACHFSSTVRNRGHYPDNGVIVYLCREPHAGHTAEETAEQLRPVAKWINDAFTEHHSTVRQTLGLVADRWWAYECDVPGCCEGELLPALDDPNSATVQLIRLGYSPGLRSSEIVKEFTPVDSSSARQQQEAFDREVTTFMDQCATPEGQDTALQETSELLDAAISTFHAGATEIADDIAARLILGLHDDYVRDIGIEYAQDDDLPHARRLWGFLARRCLPPYTDTAAPVLTLLGWVAWRQDDLPAARLALREALSVNPDYEMASLLHDAINGEAHPRELLAIALQAKDERLSGAKSNDTSTS